MFFWCLIFFERNVLQFYTSHRLNCAFEYNFIMFDLTKTKSNMKKFYSLKAVVFLLFITSCVNENLPEQELNEKLDPNFKVYESIVNPNTREANYCLTTNLIAGQNHIAGTLSVHTEGDVLIITYSTNEDWVINATHLSIGNCDEQWVPTTGSGNPKVGKFEHSSEHSEGINEVTYTLNVGVIDYEFCLAAHAEVSGPTGNETAWAEGPSFEGNSWAMYVEGLMGGCTASGIDGQEGEVPNDPVKK
jgi:hypothetical protein